MAPATVTIKPKQNKKTKSNMPDSKSENQPRSGGPSRVAQKETQQKR